MASPLSGVPRPIQLVHIQTNEIILVIKGKPVHPTVEKLQLKQVEEKALFTVLPMSAIVKHYNPGVQGVSYLVEPTVYPVFYENQDYEIIIQAKSENLELQFYHDNKSLRQAISPIEGVKGLITGHLNFRNEVGYSEFKIFDRRRELLYVRFEIFPAKMDYKKDYARLLVEVNQQIYNLAYDFLRKTFITTGLTYSNKTTAVEFIQIVQAIFERFIQTIDRISKNPISKLEKIDALKRAEGIKKASNKNVKYFQTKPYLLQKTTVGPIKVGMDEYTPIKGWEEKKSISYDTPENRFLKWVINHLITQIKAFEKQYSLAFEYREQDTEFVHKLNQMIQQLRRIQQYEFLQHVKDLHHLSITLALQMGAGYKEVYKHYLTLRKGLSIQHDMFKMSLKEISTLYEYWCFLKIHSLLAERFELVKQDIIKVKSNGLFLSLDKSKSGKVKYRNPKNGEIYELFYNPLYRQVTTAQQPDHVLSLKKEDSETTYKFVFDAKYKINPAIEGSNYWEKYKQPGPEEEDINTMHRYRDAIIYTDQIEENQHSVSRKMYGAYVLFPYQYEQEYLNHRFYKSIEEVSIGGLPFLPGSTKLVSELLDDLITETSEASFDRAIPVHATEKFYEKKNKSLNILIGSMRSRSYNQLELCINFGFYHIPLNKIHKNLGQIEYVAIYQNKGSKTLPSGGIQHYGKVQSFEIVRRKDIKEAPLYRNNSEELYVKFYVDKWLQKDPVIVPKGYGIYHHVLTKLDVFQRAIELPELTLKNEEQYRLWRELRRIEQHINLKIKQKWLDYSKEEDLEYEFLGYSLKVIPNENMILIQKDNKVLKVPIRELRYKPKRLMNLMGKMGLA